MRRPTINDVARAAGVSKSTVSLVLKASPLVREETARDVRAVMARLGYVYNRAAAGLRSSSGGLIGLIINDLRNPFFTEFAASFQMAVAQHDYAVVIANSDEDAGAQARIARSMIEHGVAALVISPAFGESGGIFDQLSRAAVPTLQVLRQADPRTDLFPFASFDYTDGGRQATRHLLDQGARRIAFVGGLDGRPITAERRSGYLEVLEEQGIAPLVIGGASSRGWGLNVAAPRIVADPSIDAVLAFNDLVMLGLMAGLARAGRMPGRDIRLVGFDDIEECAQVWPDLSSVSCDIAKFGRDVAATLLDWLREGRHPPPERREGVTLVPRRSSLGVTA